MKILFNASTNIKGGAIQTASNFIREAVKDASVDWIFLVSPIIKEELKKLGIESANLIEIKYSPAKNINSRKIIKKLENELKPDLVYTMSGPAYINFKSIHVMGCSNGYVTHSKFEAFTTERTINQVVGTIAKVIYQSVLFKKANYWIFQTESSRNGFCKRLFVANSKTFVIPNTCGKHFLKKNGTKTPLNKSVRILVPSADFAHKNLTIIPNVALELKKRNYSAKFVLTINKLSESEKKIFSLSKKLGVEDLISNQGPYSLSVGPQIYEDSDIIFLPSILETFSGTYVESMASSKPLVTTDYTFSREICGDAAIYFEGKNYKDAAEKLITLIEDRELYNLQIENGQRRINTFISIEERYSKILSIMQDIIRKQGEFKIE